jgi:hypothetical protein
MSTEFFSNIKVIKTTFIEDCFVQNLLEYRKKEVHILYQISMDILYCKFPSNFSKNIKFQLTWVVSDGNLQ